VTEWPSGVRGVLCLSFDNLGVDEDSSAARALPGLLRRLGEHDLTATFFVEGVNAELDPGALREIAAAGHEVGYHAWRHETWAELTATERAENLARGIDAMAALGLETSGLRPPGGQLGKGGLGLLREAGLRYASPAGEGAGIGDGIALLPFQWRHVDATCLLPALAPVRKQMHGSPDPLEPAAFLAYLEKEIESLETEGGFLSIVLHLPLLDWLGDDRLVALLDRLTESGRNGELWLAPCAEVAGHVLASPSEFLGKARLDPTSWAG
jgi:peptidoglycan/xylan/chitin deacetylase (PgdA/CDA1 family)